MHAAVAAQEREYPDPTRASCQCEDSSTGGQRSVRSDAAEFEQGLWLSAVVRVQPDVAKIATQWHDQQNQHEEHEEPVSRSLVELRRQRGYHHFMLRFSKIVSCKIDSRFHFDWRRKQ